MGAGTRRELENWGCYADLLPEQSCSESTAKALCENVQYDEEICLFRAEEASDVLIRFHSRPAPSQSHSNSRQRLGARTCRLHTAV